ncbi:hypothetical protein QFZ82_007248 [Streptomyces sp. V4I23]|uniref:DUF3618 domain-containing protein n=1 Tax=Streptomyces sp. V4I23 TaxID=3042282 RepID=UPI0027899346|nr:DUF3618 domain-containing protein [Streptomyces sp. V4I23]MDQ1012763.1 hypothetical protein [Streptomyces sp. V4I23]
MSGTRASHDGGRPGLQELRAQVEHSREELGRTVEELAARTDVKARARRSATEAKQHMAAKTGHAKEQVAATVGTPRGKAASLAAGAAAVLVLLMLARRRWHR